MESRLSERFQKDNDLVSVLRALKLSRTFILTGALLGLTVGVTRTVLLYMESGPYLRTALAFTATLADTYSIETEKDQAPPMPSLDNVIQYLNRPANNTEITRKVAAHFHSVDARSLVTPIRHLRFQAGNSGIVVVIDHDGHLSSAQLSKAVADEVLVVMKSESYPAVPVFRDFVKTRDDFRIGSAQLHKLLGDLIDQATREQPHLLTAARLLIELEEPESKFRKDMLIVFLIERIYGSDVVKRQKAAADYSQQAQQVNLLKRKLDRLKLDLTQKYIPVDDLTGSWPTNLVSQSKMLSWSQIVSINILAAFAGSLLGFVYSALKRALLVRRISPVEN